MAVQFGGGLSDTEATSLKEALTPHYPNVNVTTHRDIRVNVEAETVELGDPRNIFRLEGKDATEVALIRPEGLSVSQLAPYKSWDVLFDRYRRDFDTVIGAMESKTITRMAVRYINRIDVPLVGDIAHYEDYLSVHIRVPDSIPAIGNFHLRFVMDVPELGADATIQSAVFPPTVPDKASFALDIDLAREKDIPQEREQFLALFAEFRAAKNKLYQQFLTPKALAEFK